MNARSKHGVVFPKVHKAETYPMKTCMSQCEYFRMSINAEKNNFWINEL